MDDTLRQIVEKCVLAPENRLVCIDPQTKEVKHILTLSDIFDYYLTEERQDDSPLLKKSKTK